MKVLHLITSLDKGGAESHLATLVERQKKNNFNVCIFYSTGNGYWEKKLKKKKIKISSSIFKKNNFFLKKLIKIFFDLYKTIKILNKFKPNIVHCHLPYMELIGYLSRIFSSHNFKFIITKHTDNGFFEGSNEQKKSFYSNIISRLILNKTNSIIAISKSVKKFFTSKAIGIKANKIKVIYYGLNLDAKKNTLNNLKILNFKKKYNLKNYHIIYGCIARLVKQKSIDTLIKAFADLKIKTKKKIKLIIVGSGPLEKKLKNLSKQKNVYKDILWIPFIENTSLFYKNIDIFCLSSLYEGLGLVLLEAFSFKKPIVGTNSSAIPELVINNKNGKLFKSRDFHGMSKAMLKLSNKTIQKNYGNNGYKFLKKKFSVERMIYETNKIYFKN